MAAAQLRRALGRLRMIRQINPPTAKIIAKKIAADWKPCSYIEATGFVLALVEVKKVLSASRAEASSTPVLSWISINVKMLVTTLIPDNPIA